ncbi:FecR domain-containing protein [Mucilaginibacter segetis]|uniref:FecR domain-containing protein n=1 Tax=Mucilaginibacter segetis TaxID=2793071 RepID=A0A934ULH0_9SPHI|nr:FecR domain-containing protein [Mucilaginibacter segetis]MBK0377842.1 FecR domain-containing protein [Mucilaginibacter segetis]
MSNNNIHITDDVLVKYLVGEATPEETRAILEWISTGDANNKHYEQLKAIWDQSLLVAGNSTVNEDAAFLRLKSRINKEQSVDAGNNKKIRPIRWLAVAASVLLICTIGYFAVNYIIGSRVMALVKLQSNNRVLIDTLPDGSVITLNALSKLTYPEKFSGDIRSVSLEGEAFFKVAPDKAKPFIIKVNDVTVKVVGTSFNIKSRNGKTEVVVETGIVNVRKADNSLTLKPGEKTEVANNKDALVKETVNGKLYSYYINHELICDNTPLYELVQALNQIYHVNIVIENKALINLPITTVFKDQSPDEIFKVISATFNITVQHRDGTIILK